jgi:hypothetical protein
MNKSIVTLSSGVDFLMAIALVKHPIEYIYYGCRHMFPRAVGGKVSIIDAV